MKWICLVLADFCHWRATVNKQRSDECADRAAWWNAKQKQLLNRSESNGAR